MDSAQPADTFDPPHGDTKWILGEQCAQRRNPLLTLPLRNADAAAAALLRWNGHSSFLTLIFLSSESKRAEEPQMWGAEAPAGTQISGILPEISGGSFYPSKASLSRVTVSDSTVFFF